MRHLMSSKDWPRSRTGTGILSSQPEENPHWWNANMVFIPYCSSDVWSGASSKSETNEYAFMGALIIREVVQELLSKGLGNAKVLLLAGSSAGGTGVLLNVDQVADQLEGLGYAGIQVRGLADSGWFLDNKQYRRTDCVDTITCAPTEAIRRGIRYWNGIVPERCRLRFKEGEEWNCFFGYKIYPTLRCPVFVVQWLFDEAQLTVDNVHLTGQPVLEGQWHYIQNLGRELQHTLKDVVASFAPACLSHEIIIHNLAAPPHSTNSAASPPPRHRQPLDGHPGEGHLAAPCPALLGPQPPRRQQERQGPGERLPHPPDRQLPLAPLQPVVPHPARPVHGPGDERDPVPVAHGLRRAEDGAAARAGARQAAGDAEQRELSGDAPLRSPPGTTRPLPDPSPSSPGPRVAPRSGPGRGPPVSPCVSPFVHSLNRIY